MVHLSPAHALLLLASTAPGLPLAYDRLQPVGFISRAANAFFGSPKLVLAIFRRLKICCAGRSLCFRGSVCHVWVSTRFFANKITAVPPLDSAQGLILNQYSAHGPPAPRIAYSRPWWGKSTTTASKHLFSFQANSFIDLFFPILAGRAHTTLRTCSYLPLFPPTSLAYSRTIRTCAAVSPLLLLLLH